MPDLDNQDRVSFTTEYGKVDSLVLSFPRDDVVLHVPKREHPIVGAGYGSVLAGGRSFPGSRSTTIGSRSGIRSSARYGTSSNAGDRLHPGSATTV